MRVRAGRVENDFRKGSQRQQAIDAVFEGFDSGAGARG